MDRVFFIFHFSARYYLLDRPHNNRWWSSIYLPYFQKSWKIQGIFTPWFDLVAAFEPFPFSKRHVLDAPKLKEFADDNFKFDGNSRNLTKPVENTVGKGEIVGHEQFLLFPQCFETLVSHTRKTKACFGKG